MKLYWSLHLRPISKGHIGLSWLVQEQFEFPFEAPPDPAECAITLFLVVFQLTVGITLPIKPKP